MNKRQLLIIGAGGHGRVVADIAVKMNQWRDIAFLDDDVNKKLSVGIKVIGLSRDIDQFLDNSDIFVAIGDNQVREKVLNSIEQKGAFIPVLIHPDSCIGTDVVIGKGTAIMPGAIINCCSCIGKGCIINTGTTVDHDNVIENYVHLSPGVHTGGEVRIGQGTWIGIGAVIINKINIVSRCKVGAGAVVIKDIKETGTYIGIPAKKTFKYSECENTNNL